MPARLCASQRRRSAEIYVLLNVVLLSKSRTKLTWSLSTVQHKLHTWIWAEKAKTAMSRTQTQITPNGSLRQTGERFSSAGTVLGRSQEQVIRRKLNEMIVKRINTQAINCQICSVRLKGMALKSIAPLPLRLQLILQFSPTSERVNCLAAVASVGYGRAGRVRRSLTDRSFTWRSFSGTCVVRSCGFGDRCWVHRE